MVNIMVKASALVLDAWEQKVQDGGGLTQLEINNDMSTITSHIISHTTFGNNYKEGQQMFEQMEALFAILLTLSRILFSFYLDLGFFFLFLFFHEDAMCHIVTHVDV